jgi:hypothetical protein
LFLVLLDPEFDVGDFAGVAECGESGTEVGGFVGDGRVFGVAPALELFFGGAAFGVPEVGVEEEIGSVGLGGKVLVVHDTEVAGAVDGHVEAVEDVGVGGDDVLRLEVGEGEVVALQGEAFLGGEVVGEDKGKDGK